MFCDQQPLQNFGYQYNLQSYVLLKIHYSLCAINSAVYLSKHFWYCRYLISLLFAIISTNVDNYFNYWYYPYHSLVDNFHFGVILLPLTPTF